MKNRIYQIMIFIHIIIYVSFFLFVFTADPSMEEKFEDHRYQEIIEALKEKPLGPLEKLYLARFHFWLGDLHHAKAILDPGAYRPDDLKDIECLENLEDLPRNDRAQAYMYLGYSHLNLANKSEALENFIKAFRLNPHLEFEKGAVEAHLEDIIEEAKIAAQIELYLDLFVVVDLSTSIPLGQVKKIQELQCKIRDKLKKTDHVLFYGFGDFKDKNSKIPYPAASPGLSTIVESLRTDEWTDFSTLFGKLKDTITKKEFIGRTPQKAVLIISDGQHSVDNKEDEKESNDPQSVIKAIESFLTSCPNTPIVLINVNPIAKTDLDYAELWTKELEKHPTGDILYYDGSESELQNILEEIFGIITPHRGKMLITRDPEDENKDDVFNNKTCTVKVIIQCPLPTALLKIKAKPLWKTSAELFNTRWEKTRQQPEDTLLEPTNILTITDSGTLHEEVKITCLNPNEAFSPPNQQQPQILTLIFSPATGRDEEIGRISLLFKEQKNQPKLQITREFDKNFVLKSNADNNLKFQAEIDSSNFYSKESLLLNVTVAENKCFNRYSKPEIVPIDRTDNSERPEFNLSISTKRVKHLFDKIIPSDNISIDFKTDDSRVAPDIDLSPAEKINFQVVHGLIYYLYHINRFVWIPFLFIGVGFVLCRFINIYKITSDDTSVSSDGFKVLGNRIYDNKGRPVLRLRQWWVFVWLEWAKNSLKSDIRRAKLLPQSSEKKRKPEVEETNLLKHKDSIRLTGRYHIILQEDRKSESRFNVDQNYTFKIWNERIKHSLVYFGVAAFFPMVGGTYVSWPWFSPGEVLILALAVLLTFVGLWFIYRPRQKRQDSDLYNVSYWAIFGRGIGLAEGSINLIETLISLIM